MTVSRTTPSYRYNNNQRLISAAGVLRKIDPATGEPGNDQFSYNISDDATENEKHYQKLADVSNFLLIE